MLSFFKRVMLFGLILGLLYVLIICAFKFKVSQDLKKHEFVFLGVSTSLFLSHSSIFNYSRPGAFYVVHYEFCQQFQKQLLHKKVIISVSPAQFSPFSQNKDYKISNNSIVNLSLFRAVNEFRFLNLDRYNVFPPKAKTPLIDRGKFQYSYKTYFKKDFYAPFKKFSENDSARVLSFIDSFWNNKKFAKKDSLQQKYFTKLITLLTELHCEITFVRMPTTELYRSHIPQYALDNYSNILNDHPKTTYLDFTNEKHHLGDLNLYYDYGHLNDTGYRKTEEILFQKLNL